MKATTGGVLAAVFAALAATAAAPRDAHAGNEPWAQGVSEDQKATAKKALDEGNALFIERKYDAALAKYQEAIKSWDHPAIRFNIVRCLIQLDRYFEASDNLEVALKYGAAPLDENAFEEAQGYKKMLGTQIGHLAVSCKQSGAKVTLDGKPMIDACPGAKDERLTPGAHQILGTKDGFLTKTVDVVVMGGQVQTADLNLDPLTKAAKIVHRWPTWMPWVVFGSGVGVIGFGAVLEVVAKDQMSSYDGQVSLQCANVGCKPGQLSTSDKDSAQRDNAIAVTMISVGAAAAVAGGVLLYLNRPHTVYPAAIEKLQPTVTPMSGGGAALTFNGKF